MLTVLIQFGIGIALLLAAIIYACAVLDLGCTAAWCS